MLLNLKRHLLLAFLLLLTNLIFSQSIKAVIPLERNEITDDIKRNFENLGYRYFPNVESAIKAGTTKESIFLFKTDEFFNYPIREISLYLYNNSGTIIYSKTEDTSQKKYQAFSKKKDREWIIQRIFKGLQNQINALQIITTLNPEGVESSNEVRVKESSDWSSSGSGIIISSSGHIVTNYHVIEGANKVEVEFIENGESKSFNAEVVLSDKVNDLSILKIFDMNFNSIEEPPYNFQSRSVDVGTSVYAFGYPMALSLMGKELKVTDGIISAKSGFQGDITTYQISAPIQPGNSGGPLFDGKGNFIGINSSGVRKDVVENVGYTIKSSYLVNLLDALPYTIVLPRNTSLENLSLPEQIKALSKYVVLIKVK